MNSVIYYSCTGHGKKIAEAVADRLKTVPRELTRDNLDDILCEKFDAAIIIFPVHCQSYPAFLKKFFKGLNARTVSLIAVYGGADAGNAVYEAAKLIRATVNAAAYVPAGHSYLNDGYVPDGLPEALLEKLTNPAPVKIPKRRKTPFAGFLPSLRSRLIIKIRRNDTCVNCNTCGNNCPVGGIINGKTNRKCVRCLRCAEICPRGALEVKKTRVLCRYLKKTKHSETFLYV
ncbi:MAG: 4Fe-4S binding protein [Roseburia sp.]|nr:4Fe-4S binding protein [Roseburia sp.]